MTESDRDEDRVGQDEKESEKALKKKKTPEENDS